MIMIKGSLVIAAAELTDAGLYTCHADNQVVMVMVMVMVIIITRW